MKRKKAATVAACIIVPVIILCLVLFLLPFVEYVEPRLPKTYASRLTHPKSSLFFLVGKEDGILSRVRKPSLIVYTPLSERIESDAFTLEWGNPDSCEDYSILFSDIDMYRAALEEYGDKLIAFLYNTKSSEDKEILSTLQKEFPDNLVAVPYTERVSVTDSEGIVNLLDGCWGVIVTDAESSRDAWSKTRAKVIMDTLSAAASVSLDRVISIEPDWNEIIRSALKGDDISLHYTLTVLEQ